MLRSIFKAEINYHILVLDLALVPHLRSLSRTQNLSPTPLPSATQPILTLPAPYPKPLNYTPP